MASVTTHVVGFSYSLLLLPPCLQVIDLFDKGQAWEHGVPLCRELSKVYEREIQYIDLATTLVSSPHTCQCMYM